MIEVYCYICLEGPRTTMQTSVKIAGVMAEVCTRHLMSTSLKIDHCTNLFGLSIFPPLYNLLTSEIMPKNQSLDTQIFGYLASGLLAPSSKRNA